MENEKKHCSSKAKACPKNKNDQKKTIRWRCTTSTTNFVPVKLFTFLSKVLIFLSLFQPPKTFSHVLHYPNLSKRRSVKFFSNKIFFSPKKLFIFFIFICFLNFFFWNCFFLKFFFFWNFFFFNFFFSIFVSNCFYVCLNSTTSFCILLTKQTKIEQRKIKPNKHKDSKVKTAMFKKKKVKNVSLDHWQ